MAASGHQTTTNRQRAPQCNKVRQCAGDKGCQPVASRQAGIQRAGIQGIQRIAVFQSWAKALPPPQILHPCLMVVTRPVTSKAHFCAEFG